MSALPLSTRPLRAPALPRRRPEPEPRRHLEVVPSRAQRRARPRLALAIASMTGIVVILLVQLGLSIAVADGAYTISALQLQQRDLGRQNEALAEQLESLQSPQFLAMNAEALGMVASGSLPYIDLATGEVSGRSTASGGSILGHGDGLVPNTTIEGFGTVQAPAAVQTPTAPAQAADSGLRVVSAPGESPAGSDPAPVSSGAGTLPSPTTR